MIDVKTRDAWYLTVCFALLFGAAVPAAAQQTTFNPVLTIGGFYTDNVSFVGEGGENDSSAGYGLGLRLPVSRSLKRGNLGLNYNTGFENFQEFGALDNDRHFFSFRWNHTPSNKGSVALNVNYALTQNFYDPLNFEENTAVFINQRAEWRTGSADFTFSRQLSTRMSLNGTVGYSQWEFTDVEENPASIPQEDRNEARGSIGVSRSLNNQSSFGFSYGYRVFNLEVSADETTHSFSANYSYTVGDRVSMSLSIGGFSSSSDSVVPGLEEDRTGGQGTFSLNRSFDRTSLNISLSHQPDIGGSQFGTSVNTVLSINYSGEQIGKWGWGMFANYGRRDPNIMQQQVIDTWSLGARISRSFTRIVGMGFTGVWVDQESEREIYAGGYYRVNLGLIFRPLAKSRISGGS